jgi:hypothetical protein
MKVGSTHFGSTNSPQSLSNNLEVVLGSAQSTLCFSHKCKRNNLVSSESISAGILTPKASSIPSTKEILLKGGLKLIVTGGLLFGLSLSSSVFPFLLEN